MRRYPKKRVYQFKPVGLDLMDKRAHHPPTGTLVKIVQPPGTPKNGTMGHCFIADAKSGDFYGLVLRASLVRL